MKRTKKSFIAVAWAISLIAASGTAYLLMRDKGTSPAQHQAGSTITVEGTVGCLPHKGDGPHTLECTIGLRNHANEFYALKNMPSHFYATDQTLLVTGTFEKASATDTYKTIGTINVERAEEKQ